LIINEVKYNKERFDELLNETSLR